MFKERRGFLFFTKMKAVVVDGYNVIHSSSSLSLLLSRNVYRAQDKLVRMVCRYCSVTHMRGYVVFDAYRRNTDTVEEEVSPLVRVVYTGKGKTADSYIERFIAKNKRNFKYSYIYVVTSDYTQGMTVLDEHILPVSPTNFLRELESSWKEVKKRYLSHSSFTYHLIPSDLREKIFRKFKLRKHPGS